MKQEQNIENVRHSLAHLLAAAVMELWPDTKRAIGPAIENGFYFDFEFSKPIAEDDLPKIEKKMREIMPTWDKFEKQMLSAKDAKKEYPKNPYKHEMIDEFSENGKLEISFYKSGHYWDLCRGGHVESMKNIDPNSFKLKRLAGAYWRGDEKNAMLTRIYGLAFATEKELKDYLKMIEEAEKRDHRKLGKELDLFVFSDLVGKGLPLLTPQGSVIRKELEKFVLEEETKRGYQHVITPPLAKVELYKTSGHYPYYKETMYPVMKVDEEELILRPMTCPHHFMLYKSRPRSYQELPIRFAEIASQFRYEKSGELSGLSRVRTFCLADAHIICSKDQAKNEIKEVLNLIDYANGIFGLEKGVNYRYRLSLGDRKDEKKYYKDDQAWNKAEAVLREVLEEIKAPFYEAEGEAAFYGPKIDIQMKKTNGQEETAFTVQYDFVMPKRFELRYMDSDGKEKEPIVVHRSSIGAFERTMAFLIEHYAGAFPLWLSPIQIVVMPLGEKHQKAAESLLKQLKNENIRAELWQEDSVSKRIRNAELKKIPYVAVIGDIEISAKAVALRARGQKDMGLVKIDKLIKDLQQEIKQKSL